MSTSLGKPLHVKSQKEPLQLSLFSTYNQMNNTLLSEFSNVKVEITELLQEYHERYNREIRRNKELDEQLDRVNRQSDEISQEMKRKLELSEEESKINYEKSLIEMRRTCAKEIDTLKSSFKIQEAKKLKEIEELKENYEREIRYLEEEKSYAIENLSASIKTCHKQELKELELSFRAKESELLDELDMAANTDSPILQSLRENLEKLQVKVQDLREVLRAVSERSNSLYQKYAYKEDNISDFMARKQEVANISQNKAWQQYAELLTQLDFMAAAFKKLTSDNEWLVEQIDELTKENEINQEEKMIQESYVCADSYREMEQEVHRPVESVRHFEEKDLSYEQVLSTLSANEIVIKDFQDARSKLLKQFADSRRTF